MTEKLKKFSDQFKIRTIRDRANSLDLRVGTIDSPDGKNQNALVMCNGRTEWIEKYFEIPEVISQNDSTMFVSWDHRGQGASGGARAWIDDYQTYSSDTGVVIGNAIGDRPYNLICHSMGSLIALHAIITGAIKPNCVVFLSPLFGLPHHPMPPRTANFIVSTLTSVGLGHVHSGGGKHSKPPFSENILTHSAERFQTIQTSPYPLRSATFGWVKATYAATQLIQDSNLLKKITMPILVLCGSSEEVVDISVIQPWVNLARQHSASSVDLQWISGARHELLFESKEYYNRTTSTIKEWFNKIGCVV